MTRYICALFGGSIGEDKPPRVFGTKEEAQAYGKAWVRSFGGGRNNYYHPRYSVKSISTGEEKKRHIGWMGINFDL